MVEEPWSDGLLESGFGDAALAAALDWRARIRRMVEVEAALARALGRVGIVPGEAVRAIQRGCDVDRIDLDALAEEAATAATPVIPLVRALTANMDPAGAAHLHHGATSQDIIDTAVVLQLRECLARIEADLLGTAERLAELADEHRRDVVPGRTLGQQAAPVTLGLQAARWLGALDRRLERLREARREVMVVQLGGVVGTLGVYGDHGLEVAIALAEELDLRVPDLPWHAERDRIVDLAGALMGIATTTGTIATDLVLSAQTEIGEAREVPGAGPTSSALPQKRNPIEAVAARAAAHLAAGELTTLMTVASGHEFERAAGAWQAEWVALPSAVVRTGGALRRLRAALTRLELDPAAGSRNMRTHLGLVGTEALATALTEHLGRPEAQRIAGRVAAVAATEGRQLQEAAAEDPEVVHCLGDRIVEVLDPLSGLRTVDALVERALATHRRVRTQERTDV